MLGSFIRASPARKLQRKLVYSTEEYIPRWEDWFFAELHLLVNDLSKTPGSKEVTGVEHRGVSRS